VRRLSIVSETTNQSKATFAQKISRRVREDEGAGGILTAFARSVPSRILEVWRVVMLQCGLYQYLTTVADVATKGGKPREPSGLQLNLGESQKRAKEFAMPMNA
jgi:hypothetical protein